MTTKTAKYIFYIGTLSSAVLFLLLTLDTQKQVGALTNADKLSEDVIAGKKVFQKYNCNDCHTILGFGGYYAPDLTKVYGRRGKDYIRKVVSNPEKMLSGSFRKMPQQRLGSAEIDDLIAFLQWTGDIDTHDWPPQDSQKKRSAGVRRLVAAAGVSPGAALFKDNNCFDCHKLGGAGDDTGPALDDAGARLSADAIAAKITNPGAGNPDTKMPAYEDMAPADVQAIAAFLAAQK